MKRFAILSGSVSIAENVYTCKLLDSRTYYPHYNAIEKGDHVANSKNTHAGGKSTSEPNEESAGLCPEHKSNMSLPAVDSE